MAAACALATMLMLFAVDAFLLQEVGVAMGFACAVREEDHSMRCWGNGPPDHENVQQISAGFEHMCIALQPSGELQCQGGSVHQSDVPPDFAFVSQVSAACFQTCALQRGTGNVRCWGWGLDPRPDFFDKVYKELGSVQHVTSGCGHACAVLHNGTLRCWGNNDYGEVSVPQDLGAVRHVALGQLYSCAVQESDGLLRCWGYNGEGGCSVPPNLGPVRRVAANGGTTCAVQQSSGRLFCWGHNDWDNVDVPDDLGEVQNVFVGDRTTCAVERATGKLRCWGGGPSAVPSDVGRVALGDPALPQVVYA